MNFSLRLAAIRLRVPNLARSVEFYTRRLGFVLADQASDQAELATSTGDAPILTLAQSSKAPHPPRDAAGLFHTALLFPNRPALGAWLKFAAAQGLEFEGLSDHGVSEAIYFSDPDGNGLEFYTDRPREKWPTANGELAMTTRPLAVQNLLAAAGPVTREPLKASDWGHLHLRVTDLERSEAFYRAQLGMEVMQRSYPGARFLAADGYHHHLGLNTWGNPRQPQPADALGLASATFARAGVTTDTEIVDPDGIRIRVQPVLVAA
jgi:catechol 2,3-dioxygenase